MATYTVKWTTTGVVGGKPAITVPEKTFNDTATSLVLTGKGLNNYGLFQQENFLRLLENFAGPTPPLNPTVGQLWYDTTSCSLKVYSCSLQWTAVGGGGNSGLIVGTIDDYMGSDGNPGFAERINRILGTPNAIGGTGEDNQFGWGQMDYVPTFTNPGGALDALALSRNPGLPVGQIFPTTFNNSAWAIAVSRLRKALRQVGLNETQTSTVGFIDDGQPGAGNTLANIYNNNNVGSIPYQGTMSNFVGGWSGFTESHVQTLLVQTNAALNQLEQYRFSLGAGQTEIQVVAAHSRTVPPVQLYIPSPANHYTHTVAVSFGSLVNARAFFNSGGQFQFNMDFTPSAGSPSNVEEGWDAFLAFFTGISFDYKGVKRTAAYASPSVTPEYLLNFESSANSIGFYDLTGTNQVIFKRDVLDTPSIFRAYGPTPPPNGGLVISARVSAAGVLTFDIQYLLRNITTGTPGQNDTSDTSLTGSLSSNVTAFRANNLNRNSPSLAALSAAQSGTFITAI